MKHLVLLIALVLAACGGGGDYQPPTEFRSTLACVKNPGELEVGKRYYLEDCSNLTPLDTVEYKVRYRDPDGVVRATFFGGPTPTFVVFSNEQQIEVEWCVVRQLTPVPIPKPFGGFFDQYVKLDCLNVNLTTGEH